MSRLFCHTCSTRALIVSFGITQKSNGEQKRRSKWHAHSWFSFYAPETSLPRCKTQLQPSSRTKTRSLLLTLHVQDPASAISFALVRQQEQHEEQEQGQLILQKAEQAAGS